MLRSLYAGVSSLKNHQTRMDVVGNNIANVNTVGFKSSRVIFQDIYSQILQPANEADVAEGLTGSNPKQVGLGTALGSVDVLHTQGSIEYTGSQLDMSIDGDAFFVLSDGVSQSYTRAGNFYLNGYNNLVTSSNQFVQGWNNPIPADSSEAVGNIVLPDGYSFVSIGKDGELVGMNSETGEKEVFAKIALARFTNQNGLEAQGNSLYTETLNSGEAQMIFPGSEGGATINPNSLEMSNVDLAREFTDMIVTQRGYQANSRVITTSDQILEELVNLKR